ncbi:MAG: hypothetical protein GX608_03285 [Lentisphaerae bacterium]|nr:hypothetical protein [Lentisphaerota bacterium]
MSTIRGKFPFISGAFNAVDDPRAPERILYTPATLLWTLTLGFLTRCGSRNAMDADRNDEGYARTVAALSGQDWWPEGERLTAPCTGTACGFLEHVAPADLEGILTETVYTLVRRKQLDWARLGGCFAVAVDGTKQENCRAGHTVDGRDMRMALEAKLVGPDGLALPLLTEPVDQYDDERGKHDCELKAFRRLAARLKAAFPRLRICILGDALFACETVFNICEGNRWSFILTFKEGSHPAVAAEVEALMGLERDNRAAVDVEDGRIELGWLGRVQFAKRDLQVVRCLETGRRPYNGAFVTDLGICGGTDALDICTWGRRRWNIESDFNVEKHGGFGLEHTFCTSDRQAANMHLLMLLAHLLWQVVFRGVLRRIYAGCRKLAQEKLVKLIQRVLHMRGPPSTGRQFQLRFSTG